jgi:hypothetical protein
MEKKRVMDEETRKKLVGLLPFAVGSSVVYTPAFFSRVPEEYRPKFFIGPISPKDQANANTKSREGKFGRDVAVEALKNSIVLGWENLPDFVKGDLIVFSKEAIENLTDHVVWDLYGHGQKLAGITELEKEVLG